jgi:hypothetical protein
MATTEAGGIVPQEEGLLELRDRVMEFLWRVYGYDGEFASAHPVTRDKYRDDADDVLDLIESAGYELVPTDRLDRLEGAAREWFLRKRWVAGDWVNGDETAYEASGLQLGDLDRPGGAE